MGTEMLSVWMAFLLLAPGANGKLDLTDLVGLERDYCIDAAICNFMKGDLLIETQGHPGNYYALAMMNVGDSMKHKGCGVESIFTHCKRRKLECQADINQLARNLLRIPMDMLITCPYTTWPYMLFSCTNYVNWPMDANDVIPKVCRDCNTQCHLIEEFEAFQRKQGRTDFPDNWEMIKNLSKTIKSQANSVEKRQQGSGLTYPWAGFEKRNPNDVVEEIWSFHDDTGAHSIKIYCPPNYFIDSVEEERLVSPYPLHGTLRHSKLRFGCSRFGQSKKDPSKQLWMHSGVATNNRVDCHNPAGNRFMAGITDQTAKVPGVYTITWSFKCRTYDEDVTSPKECPRYTAPCSILFNLIAERGQGITPMNVLQFGCCKLPNVVNQCNEPVFAMKNISVTCSPLPKNPELKRCSYTSYTGLVVDGIPNTAEISPKEALENADIVERILIAYGPNNMKIRDRYNWTNVPNMTNQLSVSEIHQEIIDSKDNYTRWQPIIQCGKYELYAYEQIIGFITNKTNPAKDYLKLFQEACTATLIDNNPAKVDCEGAKKASECNITTTDCQLCTGKFMYGIEDIVESKPPKLPSEKYTYLLNTYRQSAKEPDTYDWVNVPEKLNETLQTVYEMKNIQDEAFGDIRQPAIKCESGTIISKSIERLGTLNGGKYQLRDTRNGLIIQMMKALGCTPVYLEQRVKSQVCDQNGGTVNSKFSCNITQTIGYELNENLVEKTVDTNDKLLQIAEIAKMLNKKAKLFDWKSIALTPKKTVKLPEIVIPLEPHGISLSPQIIALDAFVKCGNYTLIADFVKGIGCTPLTRHESILPICTGCDPNPNFDTLPIKKYNHLYTNCQADAGCVWTLPFGYQNSDKSNKNPKEKVDILVTFAPKLTPIVHAEIGKPYDWKEVADGKPGEEVIRGKDFDRAYFVPSIECGPIKIYSKKSYFRLFTELPLGVK